MTTMLSFIFNFQIITLDDQNESDSLSFLQIDCLRVFFIRMGLFHTLFMSIETILHYLFSIYNFYNFATLYDNVNN